MPYIDPTTTNLSDFCSRERGLLVDILLAWEKHGLPDGFIEEGVVPMFNRNSGHVFLTNSDYQVAMCDGLKLYEWHTCANCGHEGCLEDVYTNIHEVEDMVGEDVCIECRGVR